MDDWVLGVDFGTAFCKVAASTGAGALRRVVPLQIGAVAQSANAFIVPSALFLDRTNLHFGRRALRRLEAANDPTREAMVSFKPILGARDFEQAVGTFAPRPIDPDRAFKQDELMSLFLAYVLELTDRAAAEAGAFQRAETAPRLRYTRPGWLPERSSSSHQIMETLFTRAAHLRSQLGASLLAAEGLRYADARKALSAPSPDKSPLEFEGGIYEATGVAICHFADPQAPQHILVADIGAGTSDFAGFVRDGDAAARVILSTRLTVDIAGDAFDHALKELLFDLAEGGGKSERREFWRMLSTNARFFKEGLLKEGRLELEYRNLRCACKLEDYVASKPYRAAAKSLAAVFQRSLGSLVKAVRGEGGRRIGLVISGGGAHLPAVGEMLQNAKGGANIAIEPLPLTPPWLRAQIPNADFAQFAPQLCVAIGAAMADRRALQNLSGDLMK